jgi:hypothetical protein
VTPKLFCKPGQTQIRWRFSVDDKTPAVLNVGGPLTNSVIVSRHGRDLRLDYRLVGAGGEIAAVVNHAGKPGQRFRQGFRGRGGGWTAKIAGHKVCSFPASDRGWTHSGSEHRDRIRVAHVVTRLTSGCGFEVFGGFSVNLCCSKRAGMNASGQA